MSDICAPFTDEQVESINSYQSSGVFHDFTCSNCGATLKAKNKGLVCPGRRCRYTQNWVHSWMADNNWRKMAGLDE